jgi:hypothetical protein
MRALPIAAAVASAALMLTGCHGKRTEPVPGPQSQTATIGASWACSTAVSAGDSSTRCLRVETREVDGMNSGNPSGYLPWQP